MPKNGAIWRVFKKKEAVNTRFKEIIKKHKFKIRIAFTRAI